MMKLQFLSILFVLQWSGYISNPTTPKTVSISCKHASLTENDDVQKLDLKILLHRYGESDDCKWYDYMATEYLKSKKYNVCRINYLKEVEGMSEEEAVLRRDHIAQEIGDFLLNMREHGTPLNKVHILGHGLGAHIAGSTGEYVQNKTGEKIDRITGLDASYIGIEQSAKGPRRSLNPNDASFVDVIEGSELSAEWSMGTIDFFPKVYLHRCDFAIFRIRDVAPKLYSETINGDGLEMVSFFNSVDKALMGEHVDRGAMGTYVFRDRDLSDMTCKKFNLGFSELA